MQKYIAAISDTDILINLAKVDRLDLLSLLFSKIIIPFFVYDYELRKKTGIYFSKIEAEIKKENSIFEIVNREDDVIVNKLATPVIREKKDSIGPGESECAGYASALGVPIIISDNHTEFKWLQEYITLTHNNIISLCIYFKLISDIEGEEVFNSINDLLSRPTRLTFDLVYTRSFKRFKDSGWNEYLGVK
jgi:predicted nucleic acid-binding protein